MIPGGYSEIIGLTDTKIITIFDLDNSNRNRPGLGGIIAQLLGIAARKNVTWLVINHP